MLNFLYHSDGAGFGASAPTESFFSWASNRVEMKVVKVEVIMMKIDVLKERCKALINGRILKV